MSRQSIPIKPLNNNSQAILKRTQQGKDIGGTIVQVDGEAAIKEGLFLRLGNHKQVLEDLEASS